MSSPSTPSSTSKPAPGSKQTWGWLALAVGAGIVWGLQFGRTGYGLAPWAALAPTLLLLSHPRSGRLLFLSSMAAWLTSISWIAPTLVTFGSLHAVLGILGLLLLAAILSSYAALFGWLAGRVWRASHVGKPGGAWLVLLAVPCLWVVSEWLRGHVFGGFPWNLAATSWIEVPGALALSSWWGAYGVSAVVVLANTGLALAVSRRRWPLAAVGVLVPLLLLALAGRSITERADPLAVLAEPAPKPVRLLQPNIANMVFFDAVKARQDYEGLLALSRQACDTPGALLLWPESAAWPYMYQRDEGLRRDLEALAAAGCPVLFNTVSQERDGRWFNSALLVKDGGEPQRYDKRHLVPWGEFVPLSGLLPFYDRLARNAGDFTPAPRLNLVPWQDEQLGVSICYEVVFPEEVAERVQAGATLLITVTNDAWYGDTFAPWQHLRAARFRAAESARPLLRAAITGVSAVIGADGKVLSQLGVGERGVLAARVAGSSRLTFYSRYPWAAPIVCALISLAAIFLARPRRQQHGVSP